MTGGWQVGIDIGGTFTDVVALDPASGELRTAKVATRRDQRVAGLRAALAAVDLAWDQVADLIHGTTMVTNAIIESRLAKVALISTKGFADTIAIGRQNRRYLYRLDLPPKLACQVPADLRFEVAERMDYRGRVLEDLNGSAVDEVVDRVTASGAEAVLQPGEIQQLVQLAREVPMKFPELRDAAGRPMPADIEFAFKDGILALLQIRPFVENKKAQGSQYLSKLDAGLRARGTSRVPLDSVPKAGATETAAVAP